MTEDEALKKWCPFAKDAEPQCIASGCMAWRESSYWGPTGDRIADGYCGLAGKDD